MSSKQLALACHPSNMSSISGISFGSFDPSRESTFKDHNSGDEVLHNEKSAMRIALGSWGPVSKPSGVCRKKNSQDSIKYRKYGNNFYNTRMPNNITHEKVWRFYTQSIAIAPNDSSELALGYGNRSALLYHLEKYEDCIKDCERAIEITTCDFLKCKLLCRKAECLAFLNKNSAKSVCDEALKKLCILSIKEDLKRKFVNKLHNILNTLKDLNSFEQTNKPQNMSELTDLKYQKEAPCASKSIKITYNKQWGRHITATKDIKPGDIVAIEDNFCTLLLKPGMYLFCSNCVQPTWSSIPCRYCIYDVYCSEKCLSEAWIKYHKYECPVYPYIWDIEQNITNGHSAIRLLLIMIHKAGGIKQLRKDASNIENCKDFRTVGFSSDGIFSSENFGSMYSHIHGVDNFTIYSQIYEACTIVHLLATKTDLFEKKIDLDLLEMLNHDDIILVGALLARIHALIQKHSLLLTHNFENDRVHYGISIGPFRSLFNHSCNPNTELVSVNNNKTLIYAKHFIKKGEQLFVSYCGEHYLSNIREQRHKNLLKIFNFKCHCLACSEKWSNICIPSSDLIFDMTSSLGVEIHKIIDTIAINHSSLDSVKKIKFILETLSTKLTEHCSAYYSYEKYLLNMYITYFGTNIKVF
ncbi:SET and MYND domain-containing protein 4-like [Phymastichus coffea]|uniref:SET and MYND domain-containing protein 4-like n=1 Tax=Phymastichus coffea TaxID=108790 RepID=UPI00273CBDDE|nr:SET and MYND domain-containing protein 4-like [Phymastichus coffea]